MTIIELYVMHQLSAYTSRGVTNHRKGPLPVTQQLFRTLQPFTSLPAGGSNERTLKAQFLLIVLLFLSMNMQNILKLVY